MARDIQVNVAEFRKEGPQDAPREALPGFSYRPGPGDLFDIAEEVYAGSDAVDPALKHYLRATLGGYKVGTVQTPGRVEQIEAAARVLADVAHALASRG